MFYPFSKDPSVALLGVEAGGDGIDTLRHSATLSAGFPGVLHGVKTYLLQNAEGQISDTHSVLSPRTFTDCHVGIRWTRL
jgi:tryptophan synthase